MNSASLCSLAGRYDNPFPTRFLAPIDCLKILALVIRVDGWLLAKLVARLLAAAALWVRTDIAQKYKKDDISKKERPTLSSPPKKYAKKIEKLYFRCLT
jgi:hypothetical protein